MPSVMLSRGGAFGRWLVHEGEALKSGIRALREESPGSNLVFSTIGGHNWKLDVCEPEVSSPQTPNLSAPWSWTSPPLELRSKCLLFKLLQYMVFLLQQHELWQITVKFDYIVVVSLLWNLESPSGIWEEFSKQVSCYYHRIGFFVF